MMQPLSRPRVLVFDSGIGGLSVASCISRALPGAELIYLADNAGFPYGDQPDQVVVDRCCRLIAACLSRYPCEVIVIACNTASTVALPSLRAMTDIPVVGVVPAVKPAAACSNNRRIGILATPATIRRPYLDELVHDFAADCQVIRVGHPGLVLWAEALVAGTAPPEDQLELALAPLREAEVDTVVLGCTHYPLLLGWLKAALPGVCYWVDSGEAIARRVAYWLGEAGCLEQARQGARGALPVVREACFTGEAVVGIEPFMARAGIPVATVVGQWPGVTAAG